MNIHIGDNIKRLRQAKNMTQEKLAEYLNISAPAVSKWERGETLPDITMVIPLALYFGVSADELLGFDEARHKAEVARHLDAYQGLYGALQFDEATKCIGEAHAKYPNDFPITLAYMYDAIGGRADNSQTVLLQRAEEFIPLCQRILDESTDNAQRFSAADILAKIYHARGDGEKAMACYNDAPTWYDAKNQRLEQLYSKDTADFRYWVNLNLFELLNFAFNKAGKSIWYTAESVESRMRATKMLVQALESYINASGYGFAYAFISAICHEGGKVMNLEKHYDAAGELYGMFLSNRQKFDEFLAADLFTGMPDRLRQDIIAQYGNGLPGIVKWVKTTPFLEELRKTERFQEVLALYD